MRDIYFAETDEKTGAVKLPGGGEDSQEEILRQGFFESMRSIGAPEEEIQARWARMQEMRLDAIFNIVPERVATHA